MLGLGLGLQYRNQTLRSFGQAYISLADADGGSGGSATCVNITLDQLIDILT